MRHGSSLPFSVDAAAGGGRCRGRMRWRSRRRRCPLPRSCPRWCTCPSSWDGGQIGHDATFLPIRSSGLYHLAMPERMHRSRSPSNTVRCSSFLLSSGSRRRAPQRPASPLCRNRQSRSRPHARSRRQAAGAVPRQPPWLSGQPELRLALFVLRLQVSDLLGHIDAGEQGIALVDGVAVLLAVGGQFQLRLPASRPSCSIILGAVVWQVSVQQDGADPQRLAQMVEHAGQAVLVGLILGQSPGCVSSIYLLARAPPQRSRSGPGGMVRLSISSATLAGRADSICSSSASMASVPSALDTVPPKYFSHMALCG